MATKTKIKKTKSPVTKESPFQPTNIPGIYAYFSSTSKDVSYYCMIRNKRIKLGKKSQGMTPLKANIKKMELLDSSNGIFAPTNLTVDQAIEKYLGFIKPDSNSAISQSMEKYEANKAWLQFRFKKYFSDFVLIRNIKAIHCMEYVKYLGTCKHKYRDEKTISTSTIRHHIVAAKALFRYLIKAGDYEGANPFADEDLRMLVPKERKSKIVYLDDEQRAKMAEYIGGLEDQFLMGGFLGLFISSFRISELFSIDEDDLNFANNTVRLKRSKTSRTEKYVPVSSTFMSLCKNMTELKRAYWKTFDFTRFEENGDKGEAARRDAEKAVFITKYGPRRKSIKTQLDTCLRNIGIDKTVLNFTPHAFRHNFATWVLKSTNGNYSAAKELLYHDSVQTTEKYYAHTMPSDIIIAADNTVDMLLSEKQGEFKVLKRS